MKKFRFRLNAFLGYRQHLEQEAKQAVAATRTKIDDCRKRIAALETRQDQSIREFFEKMASGLDAGQLSVYTSYLNRMKRRIHDENRQYLQLQKELVHKQKLLRQRSMEKKAIENLKQKKRESYYKEMEELLRKESEDMVIMKKIRDLNQ